MLHPFFSRRLAAWGGKPERAAFVLRETGCVEWVGATNSKGYPIDGRGLLHRQAWSALVGPMPPDHDIHHLCRNRLCSRHIACLSHVDHAELENANRKIDEWTVRERFCICCATELSRKTLLLTSGFLSPTSRRSDEEFGAKVSRESSAKKTTTSCRLAMQSRSHSPNSYSACSLSDKSSVPATIGWPILVFRRKKNSRLLCVFNDLVSEVVVMIACSHR